MGNRDINDAVPLLQEVWQYVTTGFAKANPGFPKFILAEVYRSNDVQRALYAQGREKVAIVNKLRMAAKLAQITETENRRKVTNSKPGTSEHNKYPSRAIDILFIDGKKIVEDQKAYMALARFIRSKYPAVTWGADWNKNWKTSDERFIDMPHFQV